jgi:hypothetical protein|tara:strand:- start:60 stop:356 length:297 start_codon:yes stop_codon:yes gene_type:complete
MNDLIQMKNEIEECSKIHQIEILRILSGDSSITLNENNNGIFVNLTDVSDDIVKKIKEYLLYVDKQKMGLIQLENVKNDLKNEFFNDKNESNKLQSTS